MFKDTMQKLMNFFEVEDTEQEMYAPEAVSSQGVEEQPKARMAPVPSVSPASPEPLRRGKKGSDSDDSLSRLNHRQQELMTGTSEQKSTIDIKFPKRYEDAPAIINLLLENASILIDFQYMSETQARRCLDYLDGARSVLAGNLKKVSSTMWLLTPVNVTVNIEDLRLSQTPTSHEGQGSFDYDMRR